MPLNLYGDIANSVANGRGHDIASQRSDPLDIQCLGEIVRLNEVHDSPVAWDLGCGLGGQALRMARSGARVIAVDIGDFKEALAKASQEAGLPPGQIEFVQADLTQLPLDLLPRPHVVSCQRTIHYFPADMAQWLVLQIREALRPEGALYLSASGLGSELAIDYPAVDIPWADRYAPLAPAMANKHDIRGPVCLYNKWDLHTLLASVGFHGIHVMTSPFGNIKAVGYK